MVAIKEIYVWTNLVRPAIKCDFTKSDCWFVFYWRTASNITYGRDSNWLYCTRPQQLWACAWKVPSSIYSQWTLNKVELDIISSSSSVEVWAWICYGTDTYSIRIWGRSMYCNIGSPTVSWELVSLYETNTLVTDLVNGEFYCTSEPTNKVTLASGNISTARSYWTNGQLNLTIWVNQTNSVWHIKEARFYVS